MEKFTTLTGVAAPLHTINVDTDMIIRSSTLKHQADRARRWPVFGNAFQG